MFRKKAFMGALLVFFIATPVFAQNQVAEKRQLKTKKAIEHRSEVANFVQNLLDVSERQELGGLGEQVREIAREQQSRSEEIVLPMLERVENRSWLRKFVFGPDYDALKRIRMEMKETRQRMNELSHIRSQLHSDEISSQIEENIASMDELVGEVINKVEEEEGRFSLFGWFKRFNQ
ncbi:MAG: hypothetical protein GF349_01360 [Candidatus Magasanikbacteria bacterium]|nr:hypothetical protein [Candidatus Magasanikbacteria bacterium]